MRRIAMFSCGAASAVLAKAAIETYGDSCIVVYCNTMQSEHPDNLRFFSEVQHWIGRKIQILQSDRYNSIDEVFTRTRYMSGVKGARCTTEMKKLPSEKFEHFDDIVMLGYTIEEIRRAERFEKNNPARNVEWLLIDKGISKDQCLELLKGEGIALPEMYRLGFDHNNCIGCVKSASPGYWNKVRRLFPEVFARRCKQSRDIGAKLVKVKGERIFLDLLPLESYAPDDDIECGPACQNPENPE